MHALRENGHDVLAVCEFAKRMEDSDVIDLSAREERILITEDKDFGQLVYAHGHRSGGVILVRYPATARQRLFDDVVRLAEKRKKHCAVALWFLSPDEFASRACRAESDTNEGAMKVCAEDFSTEFTKCAESKFGRFCSFCPNGF